MTDIFRAFSIQLLHPQLLWRCRDKHIVHTEGNFPPTTKLRSDTKQARTSERTNAGRSTRAHPPTATRATYWHTQTDTHTNRCSHKACKFHYTSKTLPPKKRIWANSVNTGSELPRELRRRCGVCAQASVCVCVCVCVHMHAREEETLTVWSRESWQQQQQQQQSKPSHSLQR